MRKIHINNIFFFPVDYDGFECIREILIQLSSRFPISLKESLDLVNSRLGDYELIGEDFFYHETPEVWAKIYYWGHENMWWKKGEERREYNLPVLKEARNDEIEVYALLESSKNIDDTNSSLFSSCRLINELKELELLTDDYLKVWEVEAYNYNKALEFLHQYKGWRPYKEEG